MQRLPRNLLPRFAAAVIAYLLAFTPLILKASDEEGLPSPDPTAPLPTETLAVGVSVDPPFNIRNPDGSWTGISVELWRELAQDLGIKYEFRETNLKDRFQGLAQGWLDISIGPITITAPREEICDFTHAYYSTTLAVALAASLGDKGRPFGFAYFSFLWTVFKIALGLLGLMTIVAVLIWAIERRANPGHFGRGNPVRGLGNALWWSAVTMVSVGYGDVIPRTLLGRIIAVVWMLASVVLISTFTATMASTLTAERLGKQGGLEKIADLRRLTIAAVGYTSGAKFLAMNHIPFKAMPFDKMFDALQAGEVQAIVYDEVILRYAVETKYGDRYSVYTLPFDHELYGFALREGSTLREPLNRLMLRKVHEPAWQVLLTRYLSR